MNGGELIERFLETSVISAELEAFLQAPSNRRLLYRSILDRSIPPFRTLLLHLLEEEITFRNDLWEGNVDDDADYFEGIYHCAFLLGRCGDPSYTVTLWKAQYLNQDIGEIDAEYFVGTSIPETLAFLERSNDATSRTIAMHIRDLASEPAEAQRWLIDWEQRCRDRIRASV